MDSQVILSPTSVSQVSVSKYEHIKDIMRTQYATVTLVKSKENG